MTDLGRSTSGSTAWLLGPVIGLVLLLGDPPVWIEVVGVVLIVGFVGVGTALMRRGTRGWWRPSETLRGQRDDAS